MAVPDEEHRSAPDYMREARTNREYDGAGFRWIGALGLLLLIGFILFLFLAAPSQDPTGGKTISPAETAPTTAPTTQPK